MVNLLPKKEISTLRRTYYMRFATQALLLIAGAILVGGALLIPSYAVSERAAEASERYLSALEETIGVRERTGVSDDVRALSERLRILEQYANKTSFVPFFTEAFSNLPSGIRVTGIAFSKGGETLGISISGVAATRSTLLSFADQLQQSGSFEGVSVPVAQLALDENIPFFITATYKKQP